VLKVSRWRDHLPETIEAVFYPQGGVVYHREGRPSDARAVRGRFLDEYGLSEDALPLLSFDAGLAQRGLAPFAFG